MKEEHYNIMKTGILLVIFILPILCNSQVQSQQKHLETPVFPAQPGLTVINREKSDSKQCYAPDIPGHIVQNMIKKRIQIQKQQSQYWCWAACVQSLTYQSGSNISQSDIASQLSGFPWDRPATLNELVSLLEKFNYKALRTGRPANQLELTKIFGANKKIIAYVEQDNSGIGHSVVLQGIDDDLNIYISDPATGITGRRYIKEVYEGWKWLDAIVVVQKR